jgi:hypothetical protein
MSPQASWVGLTELEIAIRLGRRLGVRFGSGSTVGFGGRSDGSILIDDELSVMLEVEHSQTHPEGNVLKYWPWLERNRRRLVLIHAIAPDARKRSGARTDLTRWLGARMQRSLSPRFRYCRIELGTESEADQVLAAKHAIDEFIGVPEPAARTSVP